MVGDWMLRPLCWLIGHRWRRLRTNLTKAVCLAHLSPIAGEDLDCTRCGYEWRDFYGFGVTQENWTRCRVQPAEDWTYKSPLHSRPSDKREG